MAGLGLGIAYSFRASCQDALASGQVVEVLKGHGVSLPGLHIYFPQEYRSMTPLRLFIQHLKESLGLQSS
jgi:DNA-binding transcriptional LysR family regulator